MPGPLRLPSAGRFASWSNHPVSSVVAGPAQVRERWTVGKLQTQLRHARFANARHTRITGRTTVMRRYPILCGRVSLPDEHASSADQEVSHRHVSKLRSGDASCATNTAEIVYPLRNYGGEEQTRPDADNEEGYRRGLLPRDHYSQRGAGAEISLSHTVLGNVDIRRGDILACRE